MESGDRRAELTLGALTPASGVREVEEQPGNEDATARQRRRVPAEQEKQQEKKEDPEEANPEEKNPLAEVGDQPPHALDQLI
jgi:hypothetical protein